MERNQFTFYRSYCEALEDLPEKDMAKTLMAVIRYALYETEPEGLSPSGKVAFRLIRPTLDSGRKKAAAGAIGVSKREANRKQTGSKPEASRKQGETAREKEGEKEKEKEGEKEGEKEKEKEIEIEGKSLASGSGTTLRDIWEAYPGNRRDAFADVAKAAACMDLTGNDIHTAAANLALWKKSMEWTKDNGQYVPGLIKWLESGKWASPPPVAQLTSNPFVAMAMEEGCYEQG